MIKKFQTGGATNYEQMLSQLYGNIGQAGQAYTAPIVQQAIQAGVPTPPKLEVSGPTPLQNQMFNLASQGASQAKDYFGTGISALGVGSDYIKQAAESQYDPTSAQKFMNPYQQNVVDAYTKEMQRQFDISRQGRNAQAQAAGAAFGDRAGVVEAEAQRGFQDTLGRGIAGLMSQGYQQAQTASMSDYQNKLQSLLGAGQLQAGQAQTLGQYGAAAPQALGSLVGTLGQAGATQYNIGQAANQAAYNQALAQYQQPIQALQLQSGIVGGFPAAIGYPPPSSSGGGGINPLTMFMGSLFG